MKTRHLFGKALSVLLSGAMLCGSISLSAFAEGILPEAGEYEADIDSVKADAAGNHSLDGYFNVWSEGFESSTMPSGFSALDNDKDGFNWEIAYNKGGSFTAHDGLGCAYSMSWDAEKGALYPSNMLLLPEFDLIGAYDYKLTFMAAGTGSSAAERFLVALSLDGGETFKAITPFYVTTGEWLEYTVDLSEYVGHDILIGIKHGNCTNQYALRLDCINLWAKGNHVPEGYPFNYIFDDFESDAMPSYYLADTNTWHASEDSAAAHHGSYCLKSLPDGADAGVSTSRNLIISNVSLDKSNDYLLSFMAKGEKAGNLIVNVQSDSGTETLLAQTVNTDEWQNVSISLEGYSGNTVDIYLMQYTDAENNAPMYIDCLGLWYRPAHYYGDGRTQEWFEDFELCDDGELPLSWEALDNDNDGNTWKINYNDGSTKTHHGVGSVYSESFSGGPLKPDNRLILPSFGKLSTDKRHVLTFDAVGQHNTFYDEKFGVYISTNAGVTFTQIGGDYTTTNKWQEIEIDLTEYSGQYVQIAIDHHNCTDEYRLVLDCFNLWALPLTEITAVQADITEPKIGEKPCEDVKFTTDPEGGLGDSCVNWLKVPEDEYNGGVSTAWAFMEENDTFETGYYYAAEIYLSPNIGFTFADSVDAKINSYSVSGDKLSDTPYISVIFEPLFNEITSVKATITPPTVGAAPDFDPVVTCDPENSAYVDTDGVKWEKIAKADYTGNSYTDEWTAVDKSEKFEAGYFYSVEISMNTEDGYKIGDECVGTINGVPHDDYWGPFVDDPFCPCLFMRFDPTTPQNVKATAGDGEVTLTWDAVEGATAYTVKSGVDSTILAKGLKTNTATITGLTNGKEYSFRVYAYVDGRWSGASAVVKATPKVSIIPQNVKAAAGDGKVTLTWDAVDGATSYTVKSGVDSTILAKGLKTNTATITGLTNGKEYSFRVYAYVDGKWSGASAVVKATPKASYIPQNVKAVAGNGTVTLTWDMVEGATTYVIKDGGTTVLAKGITTNTYTFTGLTNGTTYTYTVYAYAGGKWNGASAKVTATPKASYIPQNVKAVAGNGTVTLTWD
ncbi:MAG: choice-of-anchor J domain-containing protein, partial [Oscillospiraceae bacterium]